MSTRDFIATTFNREVETLFESNEQIKRFILDHERKELCIDNIAKEIRIAELGSVFKVKTNHVEFVAKEYAKTFSRAALQAAEEKSVSEMEKIRRIKEAKDKEDVANMFGSTDSSVSL